MARVGKTTKQENVLLIYEFDVICGRLEGEIKMVNKMDVLTDGEVRQLLERYGERKEGERDTLSTWRIYLASDGLGSFSADGCNTAVGCNSTWVCGRISLRAQPAPDWKFYYWDVEGNYMSSNSNHECTVGVGETVTAHFIPKE